MKKILISMRTTEASNYLEKRNSIAYEYIEFFERMGYVVLLIPNNTRNIKKYFELDISMVVLSGGNNVNPCLYNSDDILDDVYDERDNIEQELVEISIKLNIPILGICRGFHFLNVYFNGVLEHKIKDHVCTNHKLSSKTKLLNDKMPNSYHNHGVSEASLSSMLQPLAISENGYVEVFFNRALHILGIQWHPERQNEEYDKKLINKFLEGKL